MAQQTTAPATKPASDPIADAPKPARPETNGAKRAREAQEAFARSRGLTPKQRQATESAAKRDADAIDELVSSIPKLDKASAAAMVAAAKPTKTEAASAAKSASAKSAERKTTVAKTKSDKTTKSSAKQAPAKTASSSKMDGMPAKLRAMIEATSNAHESRYAVKVWRFLAGKRTSAPAKTGLTSERAATIYKRVEATV